MIIFIVKFDGLRASDQVLEVFDLVTFRDMKGGVKIFR